MPLIESKPVGKTSFIKFELDPDTKQFLTFYCEFSQNKKPDPVILGALRLLFKTDPDFAPWIEEKKRQLAADKQQKSAPKPTITKNETPETKRNT